MDKKKYQVFVSSTYEDLKPARERVRQSLLEFGAFPAAMEQFSAGDDDQWTKIKRVIDECDYYMVIIGGKYGSTDEKGMSYTEKEYRYALEKKKPIAAFVHGNPDQLPAAFVDADTEKKKRLDAFRDLVKQKMCKFWFEPAELGGHTTQSIIELIDQRPAIGWVRGDTVVAPNVNAEILRLHKRIEEPNAQVAEAKKLQETASSPEQAAWTALSDEAKTMLVAVSNDGQGMLIYSRTSSGTSFQTAGKNLCPDQSARTIARWKSALSQLETNELIDETGEGVFKITDEGFGIADMMKEAEGQGVAVESLLGEETSVGSVAPRASGAELLAELLEQLDEVTDIDFNATVEDPGPVWGKTIGSFKCRKTWKEIFGSIGPVLVASKRLHQVQNTFQEIAEPWARQHLCLVNHDPTGARIVSTDVLVQNLDKILFQFRAFGLVEMTEIPASNNSPVAYWKLTPLGESVLSQLVA